MKINLQYLFKERHTVLNIKVARNFLAAEEANCALESLGFSGAKNPPQNVVGIS